MRCLHWPLYILALLSLVIVVVVLRRRAFTEDEVCILGPALVFAYFVGMLTVFQPLPRYAIPARPVSYLLAVYVLMVMARVVHRRFGRNREARNAAEME